MKKQISIFLFIVVLFSSSYSQESYTLDEAIKFSIQNNPSIQNANLEIENARQKVKETTAIGLPQINAEGKFQNFIDVPTTVAPAIAFNPAAQPGEVTELKFGTEFNTSASISASQLIFSGSYIVGLQTSKTYKAVSEFQKVKTTQDVKENVTKAYYGVLVAKKTVESLSEIAVSSEDIYTKTEAMYKQGLIEEDNVSQLRLNVLATRNSVRSAQRQLINAKNILKLQMGVSQEKTISLTSDFDKVILGLDSAQSIVEVDVAQNIDFLLLNKQKQLGELNVKYEKSQYLPSLSAFFSHQQQAMRSEFDIFEDKPWYPTTIWGLNLTIPVFSSGMKRAKVAQAKISLKQTENSLMNLNDGLTVQVNSAKTNYDNAFDTYQTSKEAVSISKKIYTNYQIKYKEGLITSLELSQIQTQYLTSESQYIQAMYALISAKIELDKITNKL